jgi:hypothetical protein
MKEERKKFQEEIRVSSIFDEPIAIENVELTTTHRRSKRGAANLRTRSVPSRRRPGRAEAHSAPSARSDEDDESTTDGWADSHVHDHGAARGMLLYRYPMVGFLSSIALLVSRSSVRYRPVRWVRCGRESGAGMLVFVQPGMS